MSKLILTKDQEKANNAFLDFLVSDDNFFIIQGAAGTGKSFLIKYLLNTFYNKYKSYCLLLQKDPKQFNIKVTATTNKAVTVIEDFLQGECLDVRTIFSLLGLKVVNDRKTGKTSLEFNSNNVPDLPKNMLIFIDEASFISNELFNIIQDLLVKTHNAKVIFIGDQYQLAPVNFNQTIMEQLKCKKAVLDEIVRNSGDILLAGTKFRKTVETGLFTPISYNDTNLLHVKGKEFQQRIEDSFSHPDWTPNTSKVLAWTNEKVQAYNQHIRTFLKLPKLFQIGETVITNEYIQGKNYSASVDSEVMITKINAMATTKMYGVEGYIIELDHSHVGFMPINFQDKKNLMKELSANKEWKKFFEVKETWLDLRPVYASSIHKSQGSTYGTVFLDLSDIGKNWNATDVARLMYVAITRASKQVICYGYLPDRYC